MKFFSTFFLEMLVEIFFEDCIPYNKYHPFFDLPLIYAFLYHCINLHTYFYMVPNGSSKRTELRSTRNFEAHLTSKHTELRNARKFEAHGTSKRTELRNARNVETHRTSKGTELRKCLRSSYISYYT